MDFNQRYIEYKTKVDEYLNRFIEETSPRSLYQPAKYVLDGGGKRIRPLLVLLSCEAVGGSVSEAIHAGVAVEILHNFTLVHDDIMDHASSRRGRATVHKKWDTNVAILAGDALLALAYRALLRTNSSRIQEISKTFTEGVVVVCEGQAFDKEFETRSRVAVEDYLTMIGKKTAAMVAVSSQVGGLIGNAGDQELRALRSYGECVGRAFQVQDDLLDIIADERKLGKTIGGDLVEGKKTFLLLEALKRAKGKDKSILLSFMRNGGVSKKRIAEFRRIYERTGALEAARSQVKSDIADAKAQLQQLHPSDAREMLSWLADMLMHRTH
ncbi:MAG: polyprenyl synthetase family protein [Ignavibacteriales bacterium]|nr:polyprenyl synthetase family protein [Ignavibacteriales bacterium]